MRGNKTYKNRGDKIIKIGEDIVPDLEEDHDHSESEGNGHNHNNDC